MRVFLSTAQNETIICASHHNGSKPVHKETQIFIWDQANAYQTNTVIENFQAWKINISRKEVLRIAQQLTKGCSLKTAKRTRFARAQRLLRTRLQRTRLTNARASSATNVTWIRSRVRFTARFKIFCRIYMLTILPKHANRWGWGALTLALFCFAALGVLST